MGAKLTKPNAPYFTRPCTEVVHPHTTCNKWYLQASMSAFISALRIYGPLFLTTMLLHTKFKPKSEDFLRLIPSVLRSCTFLAVVSGAFPALTCLWSRVDNHSSPMWWISSFVAAFLGISIEKPNRRTELAVYVSNQAVELYYRMLMSRGVLPPIKNGSEILFCVSYAVLIYFLKHKRNCLANSANGLLGVLVGVENNPDRVEKAVSRFYFWYKNRVPKLLQYLFSEDEKTGKSRKCKHSSGCKSYACVGFLKSFILGYFIRFTFILIPAILKGPSKLIANLSKILKKTIHPKNLKFALFLGLIGGAPRATECLLRWTRGVDDGVNSILAGLVGGLAIVFFNSIELSMYIASKAVESLFYYSVEKGWINPIKGGEAYLFAISTASLFYATAYEPHNLRSSYFSWLLKTSKGHWAYFYKAFTPVRLEAGVPDYKAYSDWEKNFAQRAVEKYIPPSDMQKYFSQ